MISYTNVCLDTFGYALPPRILTSDDIEERLEPLYSRLKLPRGRLELMSGIRERRLWLQGTRPSEAATQAARDVLARGGIAAGEVECLLCTPVSRE